MTFRIYRRPGLVDIFVGPFLLSVIYGRDSGKFGWYDDWPRPRIWLAQHGVVFGRWQHDDDEYF